jgi:hypothetical protein
MAWLIVACLALTGYIEIAIIMAFAFILMENM